MELRCYFFLLRCLPLVWCRVVPSHGSYYTCLPYITGCYCSLICHRLFTRAGCRSPRHFVLPVCTAYICHAVFLFCTLPILCHTHTHHYALPLSRIAFHRTYRVRSYRLCSTVLLRCLAVSSGIACLYDAFCCCTAAFRFSAMRARATFNATYARATLPARFLPAPFCCITGGATFALYTPTRCCWRCASPHMLLPACCVPFAAAVLLPKRLPAPIRYRLVPLPHAVLYLGSLPVPDGTRSPAALPATTVSAGYCLPRFAGLTWEGFTAYLYSARANVPLTPHTLPHVYLVTRSSSRNRLFSGSAAFLPGLVAYRAATPPPLPVSPCRSPVAVPVVTTHASPGFPTPMCYRWVFHYRLLPAVPFWFPCLLPPTVHFGLLTALDGSRFITQL